MTDDNAKGKLTLSAKSTLTLKSSAKAGASDGKKMVQVEVRKKRTINTTGEVKAPKVEIDEVTAQKLRLIAEAKEHEAKRQKEQEDKDGISLEFIIYEQEKTWYLNQEFMEQSKTFVSYSNIWKKWNKDIADYPNVIVGLCISREEEIFILIA